MKSVTQCVALLVLFTLCFHEAGTENLDAAEPLPETLNPPAAVSELVLAKCTYLEPRIQQFALSSRNSRYAWGIGILSVGIMYTSIGVSLELNGRVYLFNPIVGCGLGISTSSLIPFLLPSSAESAASVVSRYSGTDYLQVQSRFNALEAGVKKMAAEALVRRVSSGIILSFFALAPIGFSDSSGNSGALAMAAAFSAAAIWNFFIPSEEEVLLKDYLKAFPP